MDKEKRFCPFKSSMQVDYRNGARNVRNLFVRCSGSKCIRAAKNSRRASKRNDNSTAAGNIVVKMWCLHGKTKEIQW